MFARLFVEHPDDQSVAPRERVLDQCPPAIGRRVLKAVLIR